MANQNSKNIETLRRMARIAELIQDQELLQAIGLAYENKVRGRVRRGKDIHGQTFTPYSEQYRKKRKREGEPTHPVNLTMDHVSGMLVNVSHVVFNDLDGLKAYINNPSGDGPNKSQLGEWHQEGAGNLPVREWWGLTDEQIEEIRETIVRELNEIFETEL